MRKWPTLLAAFALWVPVLAAQSEAELKQYFEGRTVSPKLAMPGTEAGVDIHPAADRPLDYTKYADRLKDHGTAIKAGEPVTVTKIKVKDKLIEFQLGGGGYGTFGDETSSNVSTAHAAKTKREKNLEAQLKRETDPARKRAMREELDDLRAEREREDARNRANVAAAEEHRKQNIRQRRLEGGSRFNIRYRDGVPARALTPDAVMSVLAEYVDFEQLRAQVNASPDVRDQVSRTNPTDVRELVGPPAEPRPRQGLPRKGMLVQEVDTRLGPPGASRERKEGSLKVQTREYSTPEGRVTAEFVEGVLIRYTVTSE
jgi:hypothetical protein